MNIVLIGYRASGKTLIGKMLAERLGWPYLDVDRGIEEKEGGKSIANIFETSGEPHYRDVEASVAEEMLARDECIISFGGGTIMRDSTQALMSGKSKVVYLEASPEVLWERSQADPGTGKNRPNLMSGPGGPEEIVAMLEKRAPIYEHFADLVLDATESPDQLVEQILSTLT
jgi:shikimate kinase